MGQTPFQKWVGFGVRAQSSGVVIDKVNEPWYRIKSNELTLLCYEKDQLTGWLKFDKWIGRGWIRNSRIAFHKVHWVGFENQILEHFIFDFSFLFVQDKRRVIHMTLFPEIFKHTPSECVFGTAFARLPRHNYHFNIKTISRVFQFTLDCKVSISRYDYDPLIIFIHLQEVGPLSRWRHAKGVRAVLISHLVITRLVRRRI